VGTVHQIKKLFNSFKGVNKRISQLQDATGYATEIINATYLDDSSISKRTGFTSIGYLKDANRVGFGATTFMNEDFYTGEEKFENIIVGSSLQKRSVYPVEVLHIPKQQEYIGTMYFSIYSNKDIFSNYRKIDFHYAAPVNGLWTERTIFSKNLLTGYDSQPSVNDLKLEFESLGNFNVTDNTSNTKFTIRSYPSVSISNGDGSAVAAAFQTPVDSKSLTKVSGIGVFTDNAPSPSNGPVILRKGEQFNTLGTLEIMPIYNDINSHFINEDVIYIWDSYNNERVMLKGSSSSIPSVTGTSFDGVLVYYTFTISSDATFVSDKYREFDATTELMITNEANTSRLEYSIFENIPSTEGVLFPSFLQSSKHAGKPYLENASFASNLGNLYVGSYDNYLIKYDGQRAYRAGLPAPTSIAAANNITSSNKGYAAGQWWKVALEFTDFKGNLIESGCCPPEESLSASTGGCTITVTYPTHSGIGSDKMDSEGNDLRQFCVPYATTDSSQQTINSQSQVINVSYNTLAKGDKVVIRGVTGSPSTSVIAIATVAKASSSKLHLQETLPSMTLNASTVIMLESLRVNIYTSGPGGQDYGLYRKTHMISATNTLSNAVCNVSSLTGATGAVTQAFVVTDNITESEFNKLPEYKEVLDDDGRGMPPKAKYVTAHQNCIVLGNIQNTNNGEFVDNPNQLVWSPNDFPEYFPLWNYTSVPANIGDSVTGIRGLRDLFYVFQRQQIQALAGDLGSGNLRNITLSAAGDIGCVSNSSITEIGGNLLFLDEKGIFSVNSASSPKNVSININTVFKPLLSTHNFKLATGFDWAVENKFLVTIPKTRSPIGTSLGDLGTEESTTFVYEYFNNSWTLWDNFDITGGACSTEKEEFIFCSRIINDLGGYVNTAINTVNKSNSQYDYCDHVDPINFVYKTNWEHLGDPTLFKRFLRLKVHSLEGLKTYTNDGFILNLSLEKDFIDSPIDSGIMDFKEYISGFGEGSFGETKFGASPWESLKLKLPQNKAKSYRINFSNNNLNEGILISGYELEVAMPFRPEIKE